MDRIKKLNRALSSPFIFAIRLYQLLISPFLRPSCNYWPCCSEYSRLSFQKHGILGGFYLTVHRLMRCHPFHQGGLDEVPESISILKRGKVG